MNQLELHGGGMVEFKLSNDKKKEKNTCVRIGWKKQMIQ